MNTRALISSYLAVGLFATGLLCTAGGGELDAMERLGKAVFFDVSLSEPAGQACATCHQPAVGWTGPDSDINAAAGVYPGAVHERAGNRKPPSAAYAAFAPKFHYDPEEEHFVGGNFWDGRATGWLLGAPAADQAQGPFLNPVEQNNPEATAVVAKVCGSAYGELFRNTFGVDICDDPNRAYNAIAQAIFAYEASAEVNPFDSKYDYYLKDPVQYPLTDTERLGLELFEREDKGNCAACHPSRPGPGGEPPLFTDFTYDNLGFPKNPENPWYAMPTAYNPDAAAWIDPGLGGFLRTVPRYSARAKENMGKHRVPTLRNLDRRPKPGFVKAFGHNGYFKSVESVVRFYNMRDVLPACESLGAPEPNRNCWPAPEIAENVNTEELGDLGLTKEEEQAIVVFLKTLSDDWVPGTRED